MAGKREVDEKERDCTGSDFKRSSVFALKLGTEELALGRGLEVVVVAEGAVVGEGDAATLLRVVVVSKGILASKER